MPKVGVLSPQSQETSAAVWAAFRQRFRGPGWEEGRNVQIEARFSEGKLDKLSGLVEQLCLRLQRGSQGAEVGVEGRRGTHAVEECGWRGPSSCRRSHIH